MALLHLSEPQRRQAGWPILALGFRPFFLLAALSTRISGAVSIAPWVGVIVGGRPIAYL